VPGSELTLIVKSIDVMNDVNVMDHHQPVAWLLVALVGADDISNAPT
jgi:hypothetical protein